MNQATDAFMSISRFRRKDPETSKQAAERVPEFSTDHCTAILEALKQGDMTAYEIEAATGIMAHAIGKRLPELEKMRKIRVVVVSGHDSVMVSPLTRKTPSGRSARVWSLCV
jgi:predicted ArsR family transcriptional regulator